MTGKFFISAYQKLNKALEVDKKINTAGMYSHECNPVTLLYGEIEILLKLLENKQISF